MVISLFLQENFLLPKLGRIFLKPVELEAMLEIITRNKAFQGQTECLRVSSGITGILALEFIPNPLRRMDRDLYSIGATSTGL